MEVQRWRVICWTSRSVFPPFLHSMQNWSWTSFYPVLCNSLSKNQPGLRSSIQRATFNLADFMAESDRCVVSVVDTGQCSCYIVWELPLLVAVTLPVPVEVPSNDAMSTERSFFFFFLKSYVLKDDMTLRYDITQELLCHPGTVTIWCMYSTHFNVFWALYFTVFIIV